MTVREYIGARYIPLFMGEWDIDASYEPLSVVTHQGDSYTSRQSVPPGIAITNTQYWYVSGNYNAQVEAYREEVRELAGDVEANTLAIGTINDDITTITADDWVTEQRIDDNAVTAEKLNDNAVTMSKLDNDLKHRVKRNRFKGANVVWVGDSWCVTSASYGVTKAHPTTVSETLGFANLYSSFIGSRGYRFGNPTFHQSLETLVADTSFDNASIDFVILEGSINDCNSADADILASMQACINYSRTNFPNCEVIIIPQIGNNHHESQWEKIALVNRRGAILNGCEYIRGGHWLVYGRSNVFNTDNVHPNQNGQDLIAYALCQGLITGNMNIDDFFTDFVKSASARISNTVTINELEAYPSEIISFNTRWYLENNLIHIRGELNALNATTSTLTAICGLALTYCADFAYLGMIYGSDYRNDQMITTEGTGELFFRPQNNATSPILVYFKATSSVTIAYDFALYRVPIGIND